MFFSTTTFLLFRWFYFKKSLHVCLVFFQNHITQSIPQIFDAVFECTLAMINKVMKMCAFLWCVILIKKSFSFLFIFLMYLKEKLFYLYWFYVCRILKSIQNTEPTSSYCCKLLIHIAFKVRHFQWGRTLLRCMFHVCILIEIMYRMGGT